MIIWTSDQWIVNNVFADKIITFELLDLLRISIEINSSAVHKHIEVISPHCVHWPLPDLHCWRNIIFRSHGSEHGAFGCAKIVLLDLLKPPLNIEDVTHWVYPGQDVLPLAIESVFGIVIRVEMGIAENGCWKSENGWVIDKISLCL